MRLGFLAGDRLLSALGRCLLHEAALNKVRALGRPPYGPLCLNKLLWHSAGWQFSACQILLCFTSFYANTKAGMRVTFVCRRQ